MGGRVLRKRTGLVIADPTREPGADPDCGCAPTPAEAALLAEGGRPLSRRWLLGAGAIGVIGIAALASPLLPAMAATYPSWDDVQRAKQNEAAKGAEITRIRGLIAQLQGNVERTRAEAERLANEYFVAQEDYYAAVDRALGLQAQADEQAGLASEASDKAARVAAQIYRNGGDDTALELFFAGSAANADDLLARLGSMDKLLERNRDVYAAAVTAQQSAQSLSDQAVVARDERDRLKQAAEAKMVAAQDAAAAAEAALEAQSAHLGNLQAQLAALQDTTAKTVAQYKAGVEAERQARLERERLERERLKAEAERLARQAEAERRAREEAGGGGGGSGGAPAPASGWARPSGGWHTSGYGARDTICVEGAGCTTGHWGVDLSTGCGAAIYAAAGGRVTYAGWYGQHGYHIKIDHGGGIGTGYSHIQGGGILVGYGQQVSAGQLIAREGNTGLSRGCHLHFEVYQNGARINPTTFMAARGISV